MNSRTVVQALAVTVSALCACSTPSDNFDPLYVKTTSGWVHGQDTVVYGMLRFLGIPYAKPPVGELRWKAPQDPTPWAGVREATTDGNHCPQPDTTPQGTTYGQPGGQEDCLYLNVYVPRAGPPGPLPVVVWIHGGAFYMGRSNGYFPMSLVSRGVVFVSMNYRLGTLGFLAHSAFADSAGHYGNYGILDQIKALEWVRANIGKFGGDPNNVTIAGQSAGGASVLTHLVSPLSAGLFHKAIFQSGGLLLAPSNRKALTAFAGTPGPTNTTIDVELGSAAMAVDPAKLNCNAAVDLATCLRALPAGFIAKNQTASLSNFYGPAVDGYVLPDFPQTLLATGRYNRVPLLMGSTHDEFTALFALTHELTVPIAPVGTWPTPGSALALPRTVANTATSYYQELTATFGMIPFPPTASPPTFYFAEYLAGLLAPTSPSPYPLSAFGGNVSSALSQILGDFGIVCPGRVVAKLIATGSSPQPVYYYEFNDQNAPASFLQPEVGYPYKAFHAAELQYVFDLNTPLTAAQRTLASEMVSTWYRFAATGIPGPAGATAWPAYRATDGQILQFNPGGNTLVSDTAFSADHKCTALWTSPL